MRHTFLILISLVWLCIATRAQGLDEAERARLRGIIDTVIETADVQAEKARSELLTQFDTIIQSLKEGSPDVELIESERLAFFDGKALPVHERMKRGRSTYVTAIEKAETARNKGLDDSLQGLRQRDLECWRELSTRVDDQKQVALDPLVPGKDDQLKYWIVGAKVKGERAGGDSGVAIEGEIIKSGEGKLVIRATESWKDDGKLYEPTGTWTFERVECDRSTGVVKLRFVDCERPKKGTPIFDEEGDLVLQGTKMEGDYAYAWKDTKGQTHPAGSRRSLSFRVIK